MEVNHIDAAFRGISDFAEPAQTLSMDFNIRRTLKSCCRCN